MQTHKFQIDFKTNAGRSAALPSGRNNILVSEHAQSRELRPNCQPNNTTIVTTSVYFIAHFRAPLHSLRRPGRQFGTVRVLRLADITILCLLL